MAWMRVPPEIIAAGHFSLSLPLVHLNGGVESARCAACADKTLFIRGGGGTDRDGVGSLKNKRNEYATWCHLTPALGDGPPDSVGTKERNVKSRTRDKLLKGYNSPTIKSLLPNPNLNVSLCSIAYWI